MQTGQRQPVNGQIQRQMGPPPTPSPIDSELEPCNAVLAPSPEIMFPLSPGLHQRPNYPKQINEQINDLGYFQDGQGSMMRPNPPQAIYSLNYQPDPWDSQRVNGGSTQSNIMNQNRMLGRQRLIQSMPDQSWEPRASDVDSSTSGKDHNDSGYYTQTLGSRSLVSFDPQASNQDCQSLTRGMNGMELPHEAPYMFHTFSHDTQYPLAPQQPPQQQSQQLLPPTLQHVDVPQENMKCQEPNCEHEAKNPSDLK